MDFAPLLKSFLTFIKNNALLGFFAKYIIYFYIRILFLTYRIEVQYDFDLQKSINQFEGIYYFWHQNLLMGMFFFFKLKCFGYCVSSSSGDGKIIGFIAEKLGFKVIYDYSKTSKTDFVKKVLDVIDLNKRICLVGDGSRGPAFELRPAVTYFAAKSKVPLIFIECKANWYVTCKESWNQLQIPLPFSKIIIRVRPPYLPQLRNYKRDTQLIHSYF